MDQYPFKMLMLLVVMASSIAACKKSNPAEKEIPESPLEGTRTELSLDSIFLYAKHTYIWNDALPDYQSFNPRRYKDDHTILSAFRITLFDITQFKINPVTQRPYELSSISGLSKYSYLDTETNSAGSMAAANTATANYTLLSSKTSAQIAYIKLGKFVHLNELKTSLDQAFSGFASVGVSTLIIDLRNNNGGYVETAQYLANLISKSDMNGKVMYAEHFNTEMQQGKANILKNQPYLDQNNQQVFINGRKATYADVDFSIAGNTFSFEKKGQLNTLNTLYFLVNSSTASASELLINSLRPYFNAKLIGSKTYGKPVGSFGIKIDKYTLYATNFLIRNSKGEGDYFDGMLPDVNATDEEIGTTDDEIMVNVQNLIKNQAGPLAKSNMAITGKFVDAPLHVPTMIKENLTLRQ